MVVILSWILSYCLREEKVLSMAVVVVTVLMPSAVQSTLETMCDQQIHNSFTIAIIATQFVISIFCLLRGGIK
jgi:hypothetical protein